MLAFKIEKKAEFVDNVAHYSNCHLEIHNSKEPGNQEGVVNLGLGTSAGIGE